jgi:hypothetical protein
MAGLAGAASVIAGSLGFAFWQHIFSHEPSETPRPHHASMEEAKGTTVDQGSP